MSTPLKSWRFDLYITLMYCRPDESIVSEEVSVYDIKDHSEFKFRPGHVVVRVGGYEVCPVQHCLVFVVPC